jgi:hypothetical protein
MPEGSEVIVTSGASDARRIAGIVASVRFRSFECLLRGTSNSSSGSGTDDRLVAQSWLVILKRRETTMDQAIHVATGKTPWNKGKLVGQKAPLRLKDIWAIRVRLQIGHRTRELALFNLAIDSKLRSCDLVGLHAR